MSLSYQTPYFHRTDLVRLTDTSILSTYPDKPLDKRGPLAGIDRQAWVSPEMAAPLTALRTAVAQAGGCLYISDLARLWPAAQARRERYERELKAWKDNGRSGPQPSVAGRPGASWHGCARAIDIDVGNLGLGKSNQQALQAFWDLATPLGFSPHPDFKNTGPRAGASESWHFDFYGEWAEAAADYGYVTAAMAACLDCGQYQAFEPTNSVVVAQFVQSQLLRLGQDLGTNPLDGNPGNKTWKAIEVIGIPSQDLQVVAETLKTAQAVRF